MGCQTEKQTAVRVQAAAVQVQVQVQAAAVLVQAAAVQVAAVQVQVDQIAPVGQNHEIIVRRHQQTPQLPLPELGAQLPPPAKTVAERRLGRPSLGETDLCAEFWHRMSD